MHIDPGNMILNTKVAEAEVVGDDIRGDLEKGVIEFIKEHPNPPYEGVGSVHEWAEENGYDKHQVEETIYGLVTSFVFFLTEGRANDRDIDEDDVDAEELAKGTDVEKEHTIDIDTAKRIALDHLAELQDYYTRLDGMEEEGKKAGAEVEENEGKENSDEE